MTYKIQKKGPDGHDMVIRKNKETGHEFLGCSQWPSCNHTEPLPMDIIMRRKGAATLPGFD